MGLRRDREGDPTPHLIYENKLLVIRVLFENTTKKKIFGIYRPSAYMKETGNFFTTFRMDVLKKEIGPGENAVVTGILEAPAGYGEHLREGSLLSLRNGLDEEGRAIVLEVIGYHS